MLFNSFHFLAFFPVVVILFFLLPFRFRKFLLLAASYFFYMLWQPEYGALIALSTILSFATAIFIEKKKFEDRKKYVWICFFINLSILFFFKYFNFFNENFRIAFGSLGLNYPIPDIVKIVLPVGISFYTFETISYVLDVYYDRRPAEKRLSSYALYISFFPKLLAGPIEKSTSLLVQLDTQTHFNYERIVEGLRRMLWGFFKKIVIADRLSLMIDPVYLHPSEHSGSYVLLSCYMFAFQIYCDFSGYTDIAIGAAKVMGYDIVENFDRPYISKNVGEFWRRWHMSLSFWLKDYLFTPIVFKRKEWGDYALVYATFITFLMCGLWHGAKWTFVIFGVLQGIVISGELLTKKIRKKWATTFAPWLYSNLSLLLTFHFIVFSFVFFRADTVHNAFEILGRIGHIGSGKNIFAEFNKFGLLSILIVGCSIIYMATIERRYKTSLAGLNGNSRINYVFGMVTLTLLIVAGYFHPQTFIYFNF